MEHTKGVVTSDRRGIAKGGLLRMRRMIVGLVMSAKSDTVIRRRAGDVGLNFLMPIVCL